VPARTQPDEVLVRLDLARGLQAFGDARAVVRGTEDVTLARTLYARYVGA
jgi:hypothetical protein